MQKCIIVEDEPRVAMALETLLQKESGFEVVAVEHGVSEAAQAIEEHHPDLLFLDIMLSNSTAFELLDQFDEKPFDVIFTTGYSDFAIQAIRAGAFDYLLKPIGGGQLKKTLTRLLESRKKDTSTQQRYMITKGYLEGQCEQIALPEFDGCRFVKANEIVRIKAQGNYCDVYFEDGQKLTVTRQLKVFEEFLSPLGFCRVHHSHMVNPLYVRQYSKVDGGKIRMEGGEEIYISKSYKEGFLHTIGMIRSM